MPVAVFQVDAFTDRLFAGNPAAVCLLPGPADERWMQNVAGEMNLSETAFLYRQQDEFVLRWFTPVTEVELCGHATLASAHVLYESGLLNRDEPALFSTISGRLAARYADGRIEISLPADPPEPAELPGGLAKALGIAQPLYVGRNRLDYLVVTEAEETVRRIRPDFVLLAKAAPAGGVIVTSRAVSAGYDYVCRYFDPAEGINEDPVTGSAHCCLGPYWQSVVGKNSFLACQVSSRGGILRVGVAGPRVLLSGQAVTVLRGELVCIDADFDLWHNAGCAKEVKKRKIKVPFPALTRVRR